MKYATTFGASKVNDVKLYKEGIELGRFLAQKDYTVKCGGYTGMMEAVSRGVKEAGGTVIGIGLTDFEKIRTMNTFVTKRIVAKDLFERLKLLTQDSELFVVQKGSIGTLNELFLVWALKYSLGKTFRVCLIDKQYKSIKTCEFIPESELRFLEFYDNLNEFKNSF
jgi:hypothetical protein